MVEDDAAVARMLRFALRSSGFNLAEAASGTEAMRILEGPLPDAVVLDLGLPDGMGSAVLRRLRKVTESDEACIAWVVVSAMDRQEATAAYGPLGPNFIAKSFNPWDLATRLQELMDECSRGGVARAS